ncbi:hypothetical protein CYMTET_19586 [Cymbomonas tetramitiformis]|uniref:TRAM domain-containing protein n=1 Tax=Cymbomonas tetramitiformis TaxID=36881 RepID=A0AAE0G6B2_9CHLO|nr:hypothetical protein CYMTET_19586 [Cymbomonas tetramitiformis]
MASALQSCPLLVPLRTRVPRRDTWPKVVCSVTKKQASDSHIDSSGGLVVGEEMQVTCHALAFGGKGVCKADSGGLVIFCEGALPQERLVLKVDKVHKRFAVAHKLQTLHPHEEAVEAPCPHFGGGCGGCTFQNLDYSAQIRHKQEQVVDLLQRVGKVSNAGDVVQPIVGATQQFEYRNKTTFTYTVPTTRDSIPDGKDDEDDAGIGMLMKGQHDQIVSIDTCLLQHPAADRVLAFLARELPPGSALAEATKLQRLMIRASDFPEGARKGSLGGLEVTGNDGDGALRIMVAFITSEAGDSLQPVARALAAVHPEVVSVVNLHGPDEEEGVLFGARTLDMYMAGLVFSMSAKSFFQTNTSQGNQLVQVVQSACQLQDDQSEVVLDLFCGAGLLGLSVAHRSREVHGVELVADAVRDARVNAERNGLSNCHFHQGDLGKLAADLGSIVPQPDVCIVDPARAGLPRALTRFLSKTLPPRLVYVSCNPATQARDIRDLCEGMVDRKTRKRRGGKYQLMSVVPVDMFPHTAHVETVAVLELAS